MPTLHVCYIVKRFPRLSQTFVLNEILLLVEKFLFKWRWQVTL